MFNKANKETFIHSAYRSSFLAQASPYRHWRERYGMPRPRRPWGGKTLRARYTNDELQSGFHVVNVGPYTGSNPEVAARWTWELLVENKPLTDDTLLWHISARAGTRGKAWILTHYGPEALLDAFYIDIDLHFAAAWDYVDESQDICVHVDESSPEEIERAEDAFWNQVAQIQAFADHLGLQGMWITSPGDIWHGQHLQGLHVWFRLETALPRDELASRMSTFVQTHCIHGEVFPCMSTGENPELLDRAVRLPGQPHQYLVNIDVNSRSINRVCLDNDYVSQFMTVLDKWESVATVPLSLLPVEPEETGRDGASISLPPISPKHMSTPSPPSPSPGEERDRGDTMALIRQVAARVVRSYQGRKDRASEIEVQVAKDVRRLVCRSSATCDTPGLLERKVKPVVAFYLAGYDPAKAARRTIRLDDDEIVQPLRNVATGSLANVLKAKGVSDGVIAFMANLLSVLIVQHGRVAVRRRSKSTTGTTLAELAGSRRKWDRIRDEVKKLLNVVEPGHKGMCSLITLADDLLAELAADTIRGDTQQGAG
jgi:hypothetical protein